MSKTSKYTILERQRGVSLPVALILLVPLTLLGVTLATRNNLEETMAGNQRDGQQSLMNGETGLAMGQQGLEKLLLDRVAAKHANPSLTLDVDSTLTLADPYVVASYWDAGTGAFVPLSNYPLSEGSVTVVVMDNDDGDGDVTSDSDGNVILRSTGVYQGGERVVEAIVAMNFTSAPSSANQPPLTIFTEEWLKINGNPDFYGPNSLVHSNAWVEIGGTTSIAGEIQQVATGIGGTYQQAVDGVWGNWQSQRVTTGVARVQTPYVYPPVYKGMATRYMRANCEIWDGAPGYTNPLTGNPSRKLTDAYGNERDGWLCDRDGSMNKKWELKNNTTSHFYYVEGNLYIPSEIGSSSSPQNISIVAEGFIEVNGNPYMRPYYDTQGDFTRAASVDAMEQIKADGNPSYQGVNAYDAVLKSDEILLLAGGDLNIQGNPSTNFNFNGVMAAHDHMTISGNPRMSGGIIAENAKYTGAEFFFGNILSGERKSDMVTMNEISGEPDIYGSANLGGPGDAGTGDPIGVNLMGWREAIE
jgi:hypothetical protein